MPHSLWFVAIDFVIGKRGWFMNLLNTVFAELWVASQSTRTVFSATLNSREALRAANTTTSNSVRLTDMDSTIYSRLTLYADPSLDLRFSISTSSIICSEGRQR